MRTTHAGALMPHPPPPPPPPPDASIILLMHFESPGPEPDPFQFIDSSIYNRALTPHGNAQLSSDVTLDGGTVGKFYASADYVLAGSSTAFDFGTEDFTIEMFFYIDPASAGVGMLFGNVNFAAAPTQGFYLNIAGATPNFYIYGSDAFHTFSGNVNVSKGVWHHLAVVRSDGTVRLYVDGGAAGGAPLDASVSIVPSTGPIKIGEDSEGVFANWKGYIDELRVTRGYARYTGVNTAPGSCFTVPSVPFPNP